MKFKFFLIYFGGEKNMIENFDALFKRLIDLDKRLEKYYKKLYLENEIDFVMNGTYILKDELDKILDGNYVVGGTNG